MAINVIVQYHGGFLSDMILLNQCYSHRGAQLNAMKMFFLCSLSFHLPVNVLTFFSLTGGCSEGLDAFRIFFKQCSSTGGPTTICSKLAQLTLRKGHNYADSQAHSQAGFQAYRYLGWRDRGLGVGQE